MLQFLLLSTVPENLILNDGLLRHLLSSKVKNVSNRIHDHLLSISDKVHIITSKSFLFARRAVMGTSIVIQYFNNDIS